MGGPSETDISQGEGVVLKTSQVHKHHYLCRVLKDEDICDIEPQRGKRIVEINYGNSSPPWSSSTWPGMVWDSFAQSHYQAPFPRVAFWIECCRIIHSCVCREALLSAGIPEINKILSHTKYRYKKEMEQKYHTTCYLLNGGECNHSFLKRRHHWKDAHVARSMNFMHVKID